MRNIFLLSESTISSDSIGGKGGWDWLWFGQLVPEPRWFSLREHKVLVYLFVFVVSKRVCFFLNFLPWQPLDSCKQHDCHIYLHVFCQNENENSAIRNNALHSSGKNLGHISRVFRTLLRNSPSYWHLCTLQKTSCFCRANLCDSSLKCRCTWPMHQDRVA